MISVIFDMDGTLLDTQKPFIAAWDYAGDLQGIENAGRHIPNVCGMNEIGWSAYLQSNYPNLDVKKFNKTASEYLSKNMRTEFKAGAVSLIKFLKDNNIKIALASGSERTVVTYHLSKLDFLDEFDVIVCGDDVKRGKPEPDIFLLTAKKLGVNPETCFVFEDSKNGIIAGVKAGMKCIGVPDLVEFDKETKEIMFDEFKTLDDGIDFFKEYIKGCN